MSDAPSSPPASQFYWGDFLVDTAELTNAEEGVYIRLLCHAWEKHGIPNDSARLARLVSETQDVFDQLWEAVSGYWHLADNGRLVNSRMERIRAEQQEYKSRQRDAGRRGAEKRWGKKTDGDPNGDPNGTAIATPMATPMRSQWPEDSSPPPPPPPTSSSRNDDDARERAPDERLVTDAVEVFRESWPSTKFDGDEFTLRLTLERAPTIDLEALAANIGDYLASPRVADEYPRFVKAPSKWARERGFANLKPRRNVEQPGAVPEPDFSQYDAGTVISISQSKKAARA